MCAQFGALTGCHIFFCCFSVCASVKALECEALSASFRGSLLITPHGRLLVTRQKIRSRLATRNHAVRALCCTGQTSKLRGMNHGTKTATSQAGKPEHSPLSTRNMTRSKYSHILGVAPTGTGKFGCGQLPPACLMLRAPLVVMWRDRQQVR